MVDPTLKLFTDKLSPVAFTKFKSLTVANVPVKFVLVNEVEFIVSDVKRPVTFA